MLLDHILSVLAPNECLGCAAEGTLLCSRCQEKLPLSESRCFRCHRPTGNYVTCSSCQPHTALTQLVSATTYEGIAQQLVQQIKYHSARAAAQNMAVCIASRHQFASDIVLVPVPTASSRVRGRSYDQSELIGSSLAKLLHVSYRPLLRRLGQAHQVGANRQQRFKQLEEAYRLVKPGTVRGRHIVLVDDVSTTGATLEAAAQVIMQAGAAQVSGLVFARA